MQQSPTKADILQIIHEERDYWTTLIARIDPERMAGELIEGDWDVRDLLAHLVIWRNRTMGMVAAQAQGLKEPEDPWPGELGEDLEAINDWIDQRDVPQSTRSLIDDYTASFSGMRDLIDRLDDAALHDPDRVPFMGGLSVADAFATRRLFEHLHEEHDLALQAFIARGR